MQGMQILCRPIGSYPKTGGWRVWMREWASIQFWQDQGKSMFDSEWGYTPQDKSDAKPVGFPWIHQLLLKEQVATMTGSP